MGIYKGLDVPRFVLLVVCLGLFGCAAKEPQLQIGVPPPPPPTPIESVLKSRSIVVLLSDVDSPWHSMRLYFPLENQPQDAGFNCLSRGEYDMQITVFDQGRFKRQDWTHEFSRETWIDVPPSLREVQFPWPIHVRRPPKCRFTPDSPSGSRLVLAYGKQALYLEVVRNVYRTDSGLVSEYGIKYQTSGGKELVNSGLIRNQRVYDWLVELELAGFGPFIDDGK